MSALPGEEIEMYVGAIIEGSKRLEKLLIDLLDVERLSRGVVEPKPIEVDIREMVQGVVTRSGAAQRIETVIKGSVNAFVDPALVERVLENLVSNAIRHTPADTKIWIRATRRNGELTLTVEDNGPGVPDEIKDRVFEAFTQGGPKHSPGTGIGLTLVAQFAKLHGGRAWLDDRKGGGAAFHVTIPSRKAQPRRRRALAAA